jgi:hypothetical protein
MAGPTVSSGGAALDLIRNVSQSGVNSRFGYPGSQHYCQVIIAI